MNVQTVRAARERVEEIWWSDVCVPDCESCVGACGSVRTTPLSQKTFTTEDPYKKTHTSTLKHPSTHTHKHTHTHIHTPVVRFSYPLAGYYGQVERAREGKTEK